jgi:hypothetical protein
MCQAWPDERARAPDESGVFVRIQPGRVDLHTVERDSRQGRDGLLYLLTDSGRMVQVRD